MAEYDGTTALSDRVAFQADAIAIPDGLSAPSGDLGTKLDAGTIVKKTFDATSGGIRAVRVEATSADHGTALNPEHVWKGVYDPTTVAIRMVMV